VETSTIKYPPTLLEEEIESVLASFEERLSRNKMDLATYLKTVQKEKEAFLEEEIKPVARKRLERGLVIDELAQAEKLQLDIEELQASVLDQLNEMGQTNAEFRKLPKRQVESYTQTLTIQTANRMMGSKVFDRLKAIATGQAEAEPVVEIAEPVVEGSEPEVEKTEPVEPQS
jgi:FKBP-type peptidyl-prolyl cis-trans isomerase (trigger factor)